MALFNNARWEFTFKIQDTAGVAQDLTGRSFVMSLNDELRTNPPDLVLSTTEGSLLIGPETGDLQVFATYSVVRDLKQGDYYFDIIEILGEDQVMVASGQLYVKSGVTWT